MKKSQRLKVVADIKAAQTHTALEVWGLAQRKCSELRQQLEHLKNYRLEYQNNFNRLGGGGVKVAQLLEYRSFIEKLDKAIAGQEQALAMLDTEMMAKRKLWEGLHQRTQGLNKVCDAALLAEIKQEDKREQLEQDERAGRPSRNAPIGT